MTLDWVVIRNRVQKYGVDLNIQGGEPSCNMLTRNILAHKFSIGADQGGRAV